MAASQMSELDGVREGGLNLTRCHNYIFSFGLGPDEAVPDISPFRILSTEKIGKHLGRGQWPLCLGGFRLLVPCFRISGMTCVVLASNRMYLRRRGCRLPRPWWRDRPGCYRGGSSSRGKTTADGKHVAKRDVLGRHEAGVGQTAVMMCVIHK